MTAADAPHVEVRSLADLRTWLKANHDSAGSVWLITCKKAHPDYLPFGEVVAELLCWGWIDSTVRRVDDMRMKHLIAPRKESSIWSAVNKETVARLRVEGRMQPSGEAKIANAQANGMWTYLDEIDRLEVPNDLAHAISTDRTTWDSWAKSIRRGWLYKIKQAKTEATRNKRIAACVNAVQHNLKNGGLP